LPAPKPQHPPRPRSSTPSQAASEAEDFVVQILEAVTGGLEVDLDPEALRGRMECAAEEFDRRTATAFCDALLDQLSDDPANVRLLEALVILGLAHPDVLARARISLAVEGRRLAVLLERGGEPERAQAVLEFLASRLPGEPTIDQELAGLMRRSGNTAALVERYLSRAEAAVERGRVGEAIPWLQEVLLIDRTRRDVARMIRDLRYGEVARERASRRRTRWALGLATLSTLATVGVAWNLDAHTRFTQLPAAAPGDEAALRCRLDALEGLAHARPVWIGSTRVAEERQRLRDQLEGIQQTVQLEAQLEEQRAAEQLSEAEAHRLRGLALVDSLRLEEALVALEACLQVAPADWPHAEQVRTDAVALRRHLGGGR
jgi:tetratricopeptide (TPR) repeat protein